VRIVLKTLQAIFRIADAASPPERRWATAAGSGLTRFSPGRHLIEWMDSTATIPAKPPDGVSQ
jgi:hypothetical protein